MKLARNAINLAGTGNAGMLQALAQVYNALGHKQEAIDTLNRALAADPSNTAIRELMAKWTGKAQPPLQKSSIKKKKSDKPLW